MGVINYTKMRNLYPTGGRESIGMMATGRRPGPTPERMASGAENDEVAKALAIGGQASPLVGVLVFAGMAFAIMMIAQKTGGPDGFGNLKASMYNALLISLVAVAGIPVWKFVFTRFKVPGVSSWVLSV